MGVTVKERQIVDEFLPALLGEDGRNREWLGARADQVFFDMWQSSGDGTVFHLELCPALQTSMLRVPSRVLEDDTCLVQIEQRTRHASIKSGLVCHAVANGLHQRQAARQHEPGDAAVTVVPARAFQNTSAFGEKTSLVPTEETVGMLGGGHAITTQ